MDGSPHGSTESILSKYLKTGDKDIIAVFCLQDQIKSIKIPAEQGAEQEHNDTHYAGFNTARSQVLPDGKLDR